MKKTLYRIEMSVNKSYGKLWQVDSEGTEWEMRPRFVQILAKGWRDYRLVRVEVLEES